eukprot:7206148-Alexandrium_andersonii.AAC.1
MKLRSATLQATAAVGALSTAPLLLKERSGAMPASWRPFAIAQRCSRACRSWCASQQAPAKLLMLPR